MQFILEAARQVKSTPGEAVSEDEESCTPSALTATDHSSSDSNRSPPSIKITASEDTDGVEIEIAPSGSGLNENALSYEVESDSSPESSTGGAYSSARETHSSSSGGETSDGDENTKTSAEDAALRVIESKSTYLTDESEYYIRLEEAYNMAVTKLKKVQGENRKLRAAQSQALTSMADASLVSVKEQQTRQERTVK